MAVLFLPFFLLSVGGPGTPLIAIALFFASTAGGWWLFRAFCSPVPGKSFEDTRGYAIKAFVFTSIVGILLLLAFQQIAAFAANSESWGPGSPLARILFWIVRIIGIAYASNGDPEIHPILGFLAMLGSVGLCEEIVKILPVVFLLRTMPATHVNCRNIVFVGALSGLGFGVTEGLWYTWTQYLPLEAPIGMYLTRFSLVALSHGVWTMLSARLLYESRALARSKLSPQQATVFVALGYVAAVCFLSAFVHAIYNTLPLLGILLNPGLAFLLSRWPVPGDEGKPATPCNPVRSVNTAKRVTVIGVTLAGLVLLVSFAGKNDRASHTGRDSSLIGEWHLFQTNKPNIGPKSFSNMTFGSDNSFSIEYMLGNDMYGYNAATGVGSWQIEDGQLVTRYTVLTSSEPGAPAGTQLETKYRIIVLSEQELVLDASTTATEIRLRWARHTEDAEMDVKNQPKSPPGTLVKADPPTVEPNTIVAEPKARGPKPKPGDVFENSLKMKLVCIPPGEFDMGSPESEKSYYEYEKLHHVRLTAGFFIGTHEVTVAQFREFVRHSNHQSRVEKGGGNGWRNPGFVQGDDHPVVNVTWHDAFAFCEWLGNREGRTYRLPTEAEWEYACRAGTKSTYYSGDDVETLTRIGNIADATYVARFPECEYAVKTEDGFDFTAPVGKFRPNSFGLFDMHGNVEEWCADWHDKYGGDSDDPKGQASGVRIPINLAVDSNKRPADPKDEAVGYLDPKRVVRGGAWKFNPSFCCRSAARSSADPAIASSHRGFRVVCEW